MAAGSMNALQALLAEAMRDKGFPLGERGSKAELARRSGLSETIIGYIFKRPAYVPDKQHRQALARALGIPVRLVDAAGAEVKGLRAPGTGRTVTRLLDDLQEGIVLDSDALSERELAQLERRLQQLRDDLVARRKNPKGI